MIKVTSPSGWGALPAYLWCNPDLNDLQVRVLGVLSCHHATSEKKWPSVPILAAFVGKERKAVQRALHSLHKLGLVEPRLQFDSETGAQLATVWVQRFDRFNVDKERSVAPVKRRRRPQKDKIEGVKNDALPLVKNDARPGVENDAPRGVENDSPRGVENDAPLIQVVIKSHTKHPLSPPLESGGDRADGQAPGAQRLQLANAQVQAARSTRAQRDLHKRAAAAGAKCELCNRQVLWSDAPPDLVLLAPDGPLCHQSCLQARPDFTLASWHEQSDAQAAELQHKRDLQRQHVLHQTLDDLRPGQTVAELQAELQAAGVPQQVYRPRIRQLESDWRRYGDAQAELQQLDAELALRLQA